MDLGATLLAAGVMVFASGLAGVFAGNRIRGRLSGLAAMGGGALLTVAAAEPTSAATWVVVAAGAVTLLGLLAFAAALERRISARTGEPTPIDDEPV